MKLDPGSLKFTDSMNDKSFSRLFKSIQQNGLENKIVQFVEIEGRQIIVVGNNRYMAAERLGILDQLQFQKVTTPVPNTNFVSLQDVLDAAGTAKIPRIR
jgi:ParB-like chromosome segregation protein Spo0J